MTTAYDPAEVERLIAERMYDEETTKRATQILRAACSRDVHERRPGDLQLVAHYVDQRRQLDAARAEIARMAPVVEAALALREQEQIAAKARYRVYAALNKHTVPSDEHYAASDAEDRKLFACRERYISALSKVRQ